MMPNIRRIPNSETTEPLTAELQPLKKPSLQLSANHESEDDGKIKLKKELGLLEGCAIILGIIIGSGKKALYLLFLKSNLK